MDFITLAFLFLLCAGFLLDALLTRNALTSISIVNYSWVGVLLLASFVFVLDIKTVWAISLALIGFNFGRLPLIHLRLFKSECPLKRLLKLEKVMLFAVVLQLIFQCSLIPRMLAVSAFYADNPSMARLASFGLSEDGFNLIMNPLINLYQVYIGYFIQWFSFVFGLLLFLRMDRLRLLLLGMVSMVLDAIVMLGRFQIIWVIAFVLISLVVIQENTQRRERYKSYLKWGKRISLISIVLAGILLVTMTQFRTRNEATTSSHLLYYPVIGLAIFNEELQNPMSRTHQEDTYGRCFFGGLDKPLSLVYHLVCKECEAPATENARYFSQSFVLPERDGQKMYANAFNTCLSSFFMDGGWLGLFLFPFLVGLLIVSGVRQFKVEGNEFALIFTVMLVHAMVFSLAQSWFEFHIFWFSLLALFLIDRFPRWRRFQ